ncbi:hypothetical protein ACW582_21500 [Pseudomonas chlororaphis]
MLASEQGSGETTGIAQPISDSIHVSGHCEKKQRLIDEIDRLTVHRDKYLSEAENHYAKMAPLETQLGGDEVIEAERLIEIRNEHNRLKLPYDSSKHHA